MGTYLRRAEGKHVYTNSVFAEKPKRESRINGNGVPLAKCKLVFLELQVFIEEGDNNLIETSTKAGFNIKPLFRKIASSLPRMETLSSAKQEYMVDVNLKPTVNSSNADQQGGGCAC